MTATKLRLREKRNIAFPSGFSNYHLGYLALKTGSAYPPGYPVGAEMAVAPTEHPCDFERTWDQTNPGPPYRTGGRFLNLRVVVPSLVIQGIGTYTSRPGFFQDNRSWEYKGGFTNPRFQGTDPVSSLQYEGVGIGGPYSESLLPSLAAYSPQVYNKLRPKLEKAGIARAIGEMRDTPRMLQSTARSFSQTWQAMGGRRSPPFMAPKGAAEDFLNYQFGWKPFVKDIVQILEVYLDAQKHIDRITVENNRWVKRKWTFLEPITTSSRVNWGAGYAVSPNTQILDSMCNLIKAPDGSDVRAFWEIHKEVTQNVWSEGNFIYYRKEFDSEHSRYNSAWSTMARHMMIYGARVNPTTLYQLTPWSWLVDWFANVGDQIQVAQDWALDGIVAQDMYLMHRQTTTYTLKQTIGFWNGTKTFEWKRMFATKQRVVSSNPYGFNVTWGDLNPTQWAILGAIGLANRVPKI